MKSPTQRPHNTKIYGGTRFESIYTFKTKKRKQKKKMKKAHFRSNKWQGLQFEILYRLRQLPLRSAVTSTPPTPNHQHRIYPPVNRSPAAVLPFLPPSVHCLSPPPTTSAGNKHSTTTVRLLRRLFLQHCHGTQIRVF